jgi:hypothetical protein
MWLLPEDPLADVLEEPEDGVALEGIVARGEVVERHPAGPHVQLLTGEFFRPARHLPQSYVYTVLRIRDVYPGSRILIFTHPGSRISDPRSRIPDPKTATKERGEKNFFVITFYVATNFTELQINLVLKC